MPATYEPIATTTLGSAAASITFSSITSAYTDLRIVLRHQLITSDGFVYFTFNGDTGTNYSYTQLRGDGASATSSRNTNVTALQRIYSYIAQPAMSLIDIFSYTGSTNKTVLYTSEADQNGSGNVLRLVGLWRSTSAITSITLTGINGNLATGTTATLYGILKA